MPYRLMATNDRSVQITCCLAKDGMLTSQASSLHLVAKRLMESMRTPFLVVIIQKMSSYCMYVQALHLCYAKADISSAHGHCMISLLEFSLGQTLEDPYLKALCHVYVSIGHKPVVKAAQVSKTHGWHTPEPPQSRLLAPFPYTASAAQDP
jgi:hypothetical protein